MQTSLCSALCVCGRSNSEIRDRERCLSIISSEDPSERQVRVKVYFGSRGGGVEGWAACERYKGEDAGSGKRPSVSPVGLRKSQQVPWGAPEQRFPSEKFHVGTEWSSLSAL